MKNKNIGVILAGGKGIRFNNSTPKQFIKLGGKYIIEYSIETFLKNKNIDFIVITTNPDYIELVKKISNQYRKKYNKEIYIINGGKTRQESSYNALMFLKDKILDTDNVIFHDAARPFLTEDILNDVINSLNKFSSIDVAIESADTIIKVNDKNIIEEIPNRKFLRRGQTPQGFKFKIIFKAHQLAKENNFLGTDDCGLVVKFLKEKTFVVKGSEKNIKITYPLDIEIANYLLLNGENNGKFFLQDKINTNYFKNKVYIIFGYSSGIGKGIFNKLNELGAKVYGFSRSNGVDIKNITDVKKTLEEVYSKEKKINGVVNTAGILIKSRLENMNYDEILEQINTNYLGSIIISKESIKYLKETKGEIILFGSSSYYKGRKEYSIYSSIKSALVNFTQGLAEELEEYGIKVNIINPERTLTKMRIENFGQEDKSTLLDAKDVAESTLKLIQKETTGHIINIKVNDFK